MTPLFSRLLTILILSAALSSCKKDDDGKDTADTSDEPKPAAKGEACAGEDKIKCEDGLACEPVDGEDTFVCGAPVVLRGHVFDALTEVALEGALIVALDRTGAPLGNVAVSNVAGEYEFAVSAPRNADGELADGVYYTLQAFADDYQPFPAGVRVALPIDADDGAYEDVDATGGEADEENDDQVFVIENALTEVALLPLPKEQADGVTVSGHVLPADRAGGTLVVAEQGGEGVVSPYGIADASGAYTVFNVDAGAVTVRGYRQGLALNDANINVADKDLVDVDLTAKEEGGLGTVEGSVQIVNPEAGKVTSVVLVPVSVFDAVRERGAVPFGLRVPNFGEAPDVSGAFLFRDVPPGTYKVLGAFENDGLVRDPDESIGGTSLQEITVVAGEVATTAEGFKITGALAVVSPGKDGAEEVAGTPTFIFQDDTSEESYVVRVYNAFGELVWENLNVPAVMGSSTVEVVYAGPELIPGMYYQFQANSRRDKKGEIVSISRTEDLRGVFIAK